MAKNYNMYNYGTSPRKIQPDYSPNKPKKVLPKQNKNTNNVELEKNKILQEKSKKRKQRKVIINICIGFAVLFAISYRNSKIDESFSKIQKQQTELAILEKANEQLEVNIENNSNLNNLEQSAKELLGMQKLSTKQSIYVSLPKVDYIEENEVKEAEDEGFFSMIFRKLSNIF